MALLDIDVIRRVKVRRGMRANVKGSSEREKGEDLKHQRALLPDSVQDREARAEEGERVNLPEDKETLAAIERFVGPNLIRDVLARMPDHKHAKVLILHAIKRLTFVETARKTGISEKTARRYYERAVGIVVQIVRERK